MRRSCFIMQKVQPLQVVIAALLCVKPIKGLENLLFYKSNSAYASIGCLNAEMINTRWQASNRN